MQSTSRPAERGPGRITGTGGLLTQATERQITRRITGAVGAAEVVTRGITLRLAVTGTAAGGLMPKATAEAITAPVATGDRMSQTGDLGFGFSHEN